jgi:hypothetical protein
MFILIMLGISIISLVLSNYKPRMIAAFDILGGLVIMVYKVVPGTATLIEWIIMVLLFIISGLLLILAKAAERFEKGEIITS